MNTRNPGYCFQCDDGTVFKPTTRDVTITAAHITKIAPKITGWHCLKCDEIEFCDKDSSARFSAVLDEAWTEARAEEAQNIRCIRKKPGQKQAEAGWLFGGGVNAFSQYELCKTQPHKFTVLLLKLLDKRPEPLKELA
ncbi:antitoxin MqsA [Betaproteobacteria bacterium]|nr:antitoxin MqsA [Betaproteobacteria bacterium]